MVHVAARVVSGRDQLVLRGFSGCHGGRRLVVKVHGAGGRRLLQRRRLPSALAAPAFAETGEESGVEDDEDDDEPGRDAHGVGVRVPAGLVQSLQGVVVLVQHPLRLRQRHAGGAGHLAVADGGGGGGGRVTHDAPCGTLQCQRVVRGEDAQLAGLLQLRDQVQPDGHLVAAVVALRQ